MCYVKKDLRTCEHALDAPTSLHVCALCREDSGETKTHLPSRWVEALLCRGSEEVDDEGAVGVVGHLDVVVAGAQQAVVVVKEARQQSVERCAAAGLDLTFCPLHHELQCSTHIIRRGMARSFHADGPKTEKAREPAVESLVRGIWRLEYQTQSREYGRVIHL